jgi:hypothetical protein
MFVKKSVSLINSELLFKQSRKIKLK